ncbi:hypothetical protein ABB30_02005 [Stenotrophomonas ginsengisoli]|uniref:Transmembrane protein n=1 Tax=Stenotrophomonas ginsengisoli TaxID=336566 RepID=A0A0R0DA19_9GAMM|nr:hypothetical protein ABB30_02005 [Stenotrophomonas ginsengisoli]
MPPAAATDPQQDNALRLLSIGHYVLAGITALFALFPVIHLLIGVGMLAGLLDGGQAADRLFGLLFIVIALVMITLGLALAAALAWSGRNLARRQRHTACVVVAALACMMMPLGTVLGIFSIVVLMRPGVKDAFVS